VESSSQPEPEDEIARIEREMENLTPEFIADRLDETLRRGGFQLPDREWEVPAGTSGGVYVVSRRNGIWSCTCRTFRRKRKCPHADDLREEKEG
jgi:hypothetical protein